ncbi:MAG: hypothetical protein AAGI12_02915 [Pseudomonadota bacterium]
MLNRFGEQANEQQDESDLMTLTKCEGSNKHRDHPTHVFCMDAGRG